MTEYKTIYADPPWNETGGGKIRRGADRHYTLMKTPDIIQYMRENINVGENAHLYLWVTNTYLKDGLTVIDKLGFKYKTNIAWVKDRFGLGQYFRGQHELCLFGVKGVLPYRTREDGKRATEPTVIQAPRRGHSQKPEEMYAKIEAVSYPPYLELFAREHRRGWDVLGDEAPEEETIDEKNAATLDLW